MKYLRPEATYEYMILETRTYTVQGNGRTDFEAQQDAMERFHRLSKSGELIADRVSKPRLLPKAGNRK